MQKLLIFYGVLALCVIRYVAINPLAISCAFYKANYFLHKITISCAIPNTGALLWRFFRWLRPMRNAWAEYVEELSIKLAVISRWLFLSKRRHKMAEWLQSFQISHNIQKGLVVTNSCYSHICISSLKRDIPLINTKNCIQYSLDAPRVLTLKIPARYFHRGSFNSDVNWLVY